ncbi:MAG: 1,4-alpha-glucan branching protein GlgB [Paracoccaceae bacterium]
MSIEFDRIVEGTEGDPFAHLGCHPAAGGWVVRSFVPGAETVTLETERGARHALDPLHAGGVFGGHVADHPGRYRLHATRGAARWSFHDPYRFPPLLGELDEHLIAEGTHLRLWEALGARLRILDGIEGVGFAVWAPNAARVSVVGDFNDWDGRRHAMRRRGSTGVWEIFAPGLADGIRYKYEILGPEGRLLPPKADPVGFAAEMRPGTCSVVARLPARAKTAWRDARADRQRSDAPISIYEVHLGSWQRDEDGGWLGYRALAERLVPYVRDLGFTHIELMPITEHPFDGSWGYQPIGLFAPTRRHGDPDDFAAFVAACQAAEIGVILDWVPAHFPTDAHGLGAFDGTALYEHRDPREGFHPDWNTLVYNFGRREVANYLISNALFWCEVYGIDGLRVDAVASMLYRDYSRSDGQWVPNVHGGRENLEAIAFLRELNRQTYAAHPTAMTVAEESTAWPGVSRPVDQDGLGFGFKWNLGWMHDTLEYMKADPLYRSHHHGKMSFGLHYAFSENFVLPLSHDEVVHGKGSILGRMPGDRTAKFANLRAYCGFMFAHPGKKLLFMGQEFGQEGEWDHEAALPWQALGDPLHRGVRDLVRDLNGLYRSRPALHQGDARPEGFEWIDGAATDASVYAWLRKAEGSAPVLAVFNFAGVAHTDWRLGVPEGGTWAEILNTDAGVYGGGDRGNLGGVAAEAVPAHGQPHSVVLTLPPLSALYLEPRA